MLTPAPTTSEIVLKRAALLRAASPGKFTVETSIEAVYDADPELWALRKRELARGEAQTDTVAALEKVVADREHAENPSLTIAKRVFGLRASDPTLTETQALEQVCHEDPALYELYRRRDMHKHQWPVVPPTPTVVTGDPLEQIQKRMAAGEPLDAIMKRNPALWEAYRQAQITKLDSPLTKRRRALAKGR